MLFWDIVFTIYWPYSLGRFLRGYGTPLSGHFWDTFLGHLLLHVTFLYSLLRRLLCCNVVLVMSVTQVTQVIVVRQVKTGNASHAGNAKNASKVGNASNTGKTGIIGNTGIALPHSLTSITCLYQHY